MPEREQIDFSSPAPRGRVLGSGCIPRCPRQGQRGPDSNAVDIDIALKETSIERDRHGAFSRRSNTQFCPERLDSHTGTGLHGHDFSRSQGVESQPHQRRFGSTEIRQVEATAPPSRPLRRERSPGPNLNLQYAHFRVGQAGATREKRHNFQNRRWWDRSRGIRRRHWK
jgi:hypothetical protein